MDMLVYNKVVSHLSSTKSGDLYCDQMGVTIDSASWCLLLGIRVWQCAPVPRSIIWNQGILSLGYSREKDKGGGGGN